MNIKHFLLKTHKILEDVGIDHALIGGLALGALGIERFTNDVDFLVPEKDRLKVKAEFARHAYKIFFESEEVLQLEGPGQIDFLFARRAPTLEMLKRAKILPTLKIKCLVAEDMIGLKIQAYKNNPRREFQDKADIQALIEKTEKIDWKIVKSHADLFDEWTIVATMRDKLK